MMTTQEFVKDKTPRAGFWRVRAKVKTDLSTEIRQEIAAVAPPPSQSRDGAFSSLPPAVPASQIHTDASAETQHSLKPVAAKARRVTAPVPAPSKTAGVGAYVSCDGLGDVGEAAPQRGAEPCPEVAASDISDGASAIGAGSTPAPSRPTIGSNWIAQRFERFAAAVAYLKTHNVGVQVVNKDADIKKYRVSSQGFQTFYHEDVLEIAMDLGWAG